MSQVDEAIASRNAGWSFAGISDAFEDHVARSVPLYNEGHDLICKYSDFFVRDDSTIYEIGCSTGALSRKLLKWHSGRTDLRLVGIDPVADMIELARKRGSDDPRGSYLCDDANAVDMSGADVIVSYYTMQFIPPRIRQDIFDHVWRSLNWGGAFFLFEKVRAPDARFQDYAAQVYADFKLDRGFSEENIVHKTRSLKGVLEPFSTNGNLDLMRRAGFVDMMTILKWTCFEGFLAIK